MNNTCDALQTRLTGRRPCLFVSEVGVTMLCVFDVNCSGEADQDCNN